MKARPKGKGVRRLSQRAGTRARVKRVYFVGAGLTAGLKYPVGATLMQDLVRYLQNRPPTHGAGRKYRNRLFEDERNVERAKKLVAAIQVVLRRYFALSLDQVARVDVAEFFSVVQAFAEDPALFGAGGERPGRREAERRPTASLLFQDLSAAMRSRFFDIGKQWVETPRDLLSFVNKVRMSEDAIVNFNWDEELDFSLDAKAAGVGYTSLSARAEGRVLMLKPHGSIGWYDVKQGIGNREAYFISEGDPRIPRELQRVVAFPANETPRDIDGRTKHSLLECPPVITAPTFSKRFDYPEQKLIWEDVLAACREAREYVFLGYSLPRDDFLSRAAIRSALLDNDGARRRVLLVDRSFEDKRANFESVFGLGLTAERNFLQWTFGCGDRQFAEAMEARLEDAAVPR